jgi:hypothetical protein
MQLPHFHIKAQTLIFFSCVIKILMRVDTNKNQGEMAEKGVNNGTNQKGNFA